MTRACLLLALASGACADPGIVLAPYIEIPPSSSTAYPYEGLEEIELSISRSGDATPLSLATGAMGEPLALTNVPFGDDLIVHFSGKAAGVEIAYGRTCPMDIAPDAPLIAPRLYFSRIVRWGATPASAPAAPTRVGGHAYGLSGGLTVFAGGDTGEIELFDPLSTGSFAVLEPRTLLRQRGVLLPFQTGTAIIVGGVDTAGNAIATVEIMNPQAETPGRQLEGFPGPALRGHAGVTLVNDTIIVAGGEEQERPGDPFTVTDRAWQFQLGPGGVLEVPEELAQRMYLARTAHTMTRLGTEIGADVLIVGGHDSTGQPVARAELYRPLREAFEPIEGADLTTPRWGHAAVRMPGGFVLIIGGMRPEGMDGPPVPELGLELYDPIQGTFAPAGVLPANAGLTELSVTPLPDGRVLLAGGRDAAGAPVATVLIARLDPLDGQVDISPTDSLDVPRAGHSAVSLCDGTILIVGGTDDATAPAERYNPPSAGRR